MEVVGTAHVLPVDYCVSYCNGVFLSVAALRRRFAWRVGIRIRMQSLQ